MTIQSSYCRLLYCYCTVLYSTFQYGDGMCQTLFLSNATQYLPTYLIVTNLIPSLFCTHEKVGVSFMYRLFLIAMFHLVQKLDKKN